MCLAVRDENERAGLKRISMAFDNRLPASAFDIKSLIRAFMPVVFPDFAFARLGCRSGDIGIIASPLAAEAPPENERARAKRLFLNASLFTGSSRRPYRRYERPQAPEASLTHFFVKLVWAAP